MPLYVPPELQFSVTGSAPLPESAVEAFLSIARKITSDKGRQRVLERFKEHFCNASGSSYAPSSTVSWAESDLNSAANGAAENAAGFIAAFYHACEDLERSGSSVPNSDFINKMLDEGNKLIVVSSYSNTIKVPFKDEYGNWEFTEFKYDSDDIQISM